MKVSNAAAAVAALYLITAGGVPAYATPLFTAIDLTVKYPDFQATHMNDAGMIVGRAGDQLAILSGGMLHLLGNNGTGMYAGSISPSGEIAWWADDGSTGYRTVGGTFVTIQPDGTIFPGPRRSINDSDEIMGSSASSFGTVFYDGSTATKLKQGNSSGIAINNNGQAIGTFYNSVSDNGSFTFDGSDLVLYRGYGFYSINQSGLIVGVNSANHAVSMSFGGGMITDLGVAPGDTVSVAQDVNGLGVAVGWGRPAGRSHAVLFQDGQAYDLNALIQPGFGQHLGAASAVSDGLYILADADNGDTILLVPSTQAAVPEPSTCVLLAAPLLALLVKVWRDFFQATHRLPLDR